MAQLSSACYILLFKCNYRAYSDLAILELGLEIWIYQQRRNGLLLLTLPCGVFSDPTATCHTPPCPLLPCHPPFLPSHQSSKIKLKFFIQFKLNLSSWNLVSKSIAKAKPKLIQTKSWAKAKGESKPKVKRFIRVWHCCRLNRVGVNVKMILLNFLLYIYIKIQEHRGPTGLLF